MCPLARNDTVFDSFCTDFVAYGIEKFVIARPVRRLVVAIPWISQDFGGGCHGYLKQFNESEFVVRDFITEFAPAVG